jgi:hypothetical protein
VDILLVVFFNFNFFLSFTESIMVRMEEIGRNGDDQWFALSARRGDASRRRARRSRRPEPFRCCPVSTKFQGEWASVETFPRPLFCLSLRTRIKTIMIYISQPMQGGYSYWLPTLRIFLDTTDLYIANSSRLIMTQQKLWTTVIEGLIIKQ